MSLFVDHLTPVIGDIVGIYVDSPGNHSILATPTPAPEPASAWPLSGGLIALLGVVRSKTRG